MITTAKPEKFLKKTCKVSYRFTMLRSVTAYFSRSHAPAWEREKQIYLKSASVPICSNFLVISLTDNGRLK